MGQKVMPTGFRLGITEDWRSRWYSDKDYAKNLANDMEIRKFLDKYLAKAAVAKVEIERAGDKVKVIITTARPGVVIGKKGSEIEQLRKELAKIVGGPVNIEVIEVKRPELDANLVAQSIAEQLEGRVPLHTLRAKIDYGFCTAATTMGSIGIKVWIYHGEKLPGGKTPQPALEGNSRPSRGRRDRNDRNERGAK